MLKFVELQGTHSGENMAKAIYVCLQELGLECKLLTITGDNTSNNETLIKEL